MLASDSFTDRAAAMLGCLRDIPRLAVMPQLRDCAVVGASDILRIEPRADAIDAHASVWRINNAPTLSFEWQVGARTDVRIVNAVLPKVWDKHQSAVHGEARVPPSLEYDERLCTGDEVCFVHATNLGDREKVRRHVRANARHNIDLLHVDTFSRVRNCTGTVSLSTGTLGIAMALRTCAGPVHVYGFLGECCQRKMPWLPAMNYKYFHTAASAWVCCAQGREDTLPQMRLLLALEALGALRLHLSDALKRALLRPPLGAAAGRHERYPAPGALAHQRRAGRPAATALPLRPGGGAGGGLFGLHRRNGSSALGRAVRGPVRREVIGP